MIIKSYPPEILLIPLSIYFLLWLPNIWKGVKRDKKHLIFLIVGFLLIAGTGIRTWKDVNHALYYYAPEERIEQSLLESCLYNQKYNCKRWDGDLTIKSQIDGVDLSKTEQRIFYKRDLEKLKSNDLSVLRLGLNCSVIESDVDEVTGYFNIKARCGNNSLQLIFNKYICIEYLNKTDVCPIAYANGLLKG